MLRKHLPLLAALEIAFQVFKGSILLSISSDLQVLVPSHHCSSNKFFKHWEGRNVTVHLVDKNPILVNTSLVGQRRDHHLPSSKI